MAPVAIEGVLAVAKCSVAQIQVRIYGNAITQVVTPAKAGVQRILRRLDSGLRRNDEPNTSP